MGLLLEFGCSAAPGIGGIAGQLHPVDGKHLVPDESLGIASEQHLGKEVGSDQPLPSAEDLAVSRL